MIVQIKDIAFDVDKGEYLLVDEEQADFETLLEDLESRYTGRIIELTGNGSDEIDLESELLELIESNTGCSIRELQYKIV